jgi:hypothetical protein
MKKIVFLIAILHSLAAFSQFNDNFNDGLFASSASLTRNVEWSGDADDFTVNTALQLQLDADGTHSLSQLKTTSSALKNTSWEFYVRMDFAVTTANYAKIYLASDEADLSSELNGFFIRIGGHADKNICLMFSQKGKSNQTLIKGAPLRLTDEHSNAVKIKATLDQGGNFNLYSQLDTEDDYTLEGSATIGVFPETLWFGIACIYSKTRSKLFFFDDFVVSVLDENAQPEPEEELPVEGDIVFSEIMANPANENPEYVELYNSANKTFRLKNCLFFYDDKSFSLPDTLIAPNSYFVLTKTTATAWFGNGVNAVGVTAFPALANTGKLLSLQTIAGELIDWFEYSDKMYGDSDKDGGGWSLECIDLSNRSNTADNWSASVDPEGGTPGSANSIRGEHPDLIAPAILSYSQGDNHTVTVAFSKPMNRQKLLDENAFRITESAYRINDLQTNFPYGTVLTILLNDFPPQGNFFEIELNGLTDLSGHILSENKVLLIGQAFEAQANDIVINELLFNPPPGGNEYVEIYNRADKRIDLRAISITSRKPSDGSLNKLYPISELPLFLEPEAYLVITKDRESVCQLFNCPSESAFVELPVMPSIANTSGCVVIYNNHTETILDEFAYSESLHADGIKNKKGVALERVNFERPVTEAGNWLSATEQSGYGTPGYLNSQYSEGTKLETDIRIEYPSIGIDEYRIHYRLDKPGYKCKIHIYDAIGRMIDSLLDGKLLGSDGEIPWNGKAKSNQKLTSGIYVLYVELYDSNGMLQKVKIPVVMK